MNALVFGVLVGSFLSWYVQIVSGLGSHGITRSSGSSKGAIKDFRRAADALGLRSVFDKVASHAGTRRGYESIMDLVLDNSHNVLSLSPSTYQLTSERQRMIRESRTVEESPGLERFRTCVAESASEAVQMYDVLAQADLLLRDDMGGLQVPPIYGGNLSPFSTTEIPVTDYDEWLYIQVEDWNLEYILQAEQVVKMLIEVQSWSEREEVHVTAPALAKIGKCIMKDSLESLLRVIEGSVRLSRVRTATDPRAVSSFVFSLNEEKYPVLRVMQNRIDELETNSVLAIDLADEQDAKETEILKGLALSIQKKAGHINAGLNAVAELDVCLAKAAYGVVSNGAVPLIGSEGKINVKGFEHPAIQETPGKIAVPVDLRLTDTRSLIISGINGGGKTLAMNSFAIVCLLSKVGLPISVDRASKPRVDFFDTIMMDIGDPQQLETGESTFLGHLNKFSEMIETVFKPGNGNKSTLVLLDELGTASEPAAAGAIAQAVIEKMTSSEKCRVIATTHSEWLKSVSFNDNHFGCASVLATDKKSSRTFEPTFSLQYGTIGASDPLSATRRADPAFPGDVLTRATDLVESQAAPDTVSYRQTYSKALTASLSHQLVLWKDSSKEVATCKSDILRMKSAMMSLASNYHHHLKQLERRVEHCFKTLKQEKDEVELLGATLSELRTVRLAVKSETEMLKERGLCPLDYSRCLSPGESVVITSGEWNGAMAKVVMDHGLPTGSVSVAIVDGQYTLGDSELQNPTCTPSENVLVFHRQELAQWDSGNSDHEHEWRDSPPLIGINESSRRLDSLLGSLKTERTSPPQTKRAKICDVERKRFSSARQRKAEKKRKRPKRRKSRR